MLMSNKVVQDNLKEQCDRDDEDEVQEISAAITPMKKRKSLCIFKQGRIHITVLCVSRNSFP